MQDLPVGFNSRELKREALKLMAKLWSHPRARGKYNIAVDKLIPGAITKVSLRSSRTDNIRLAIEYMYNSIPREFKVPLTRQECSEYIFPLSYTPGMIVTNGVIPVMDEIVSPCPTYNIQPEISFNKAETVLMTSKKGTERYKVTDRTVLISQVSGTLHYVSNKKGGTIGPVMGIGIGGQIVINPSYVDKVYDQMKGATGSRYYESI